MTATYNFDAQKWSEVEKEDRLRTVDRIRERLLAERVASKKAKHDADRLGNKLAEIENTLIEETKSRNRAEKKLKILIKKLESMNIPYVSNEAEYSCSVDRSCIDSSSLCVSSLCIKETEEDITLKENDQIQQNGSRFSLLSASRVSSANDESPSSEFEVDCPEIKGLKSQMGWNGYPITQSISEDLNTNVAECHGIEDSSTDGSEQHLEEFNVNENDSTALVLVDKLQKTSDQRAGPEVLDATVKEVLDALRRAKEKLQRSMA